MSQTVIKIENLYKEYRLGVISHGTLYRDLQSWWARVRDKEDPNSLVGHSSDGDRGENSDHVLALEDINLEVKKGEILGIIGRNGAGKSTLLKILSRITTPTQGTIKIKGRVASLLEVGTGFHPELTGRENIFLNGAILGMTRAEIYSKFDEIVDFSGVERHIDTPVKRYSSGMHVRLAFAVAAHLEPEILVVDEVLAVGDTEFQKKCLGKMGEVGKEGMTVLFVSHNMDTVSALCKSGIMLEKGKIFYHGDISETILTYKQSMMNNQLSIENSSSRGGSGGIKITNVWVDNHSNKKTDVIRSNKPISLNLDALLSPEYQTGKKISVGFAIDNFEGRRLFTLVSSWENAEIITNGERLAVKCLIPSVPFVPGKYLVSASILYQMDTLDCAVHCASFEVIEEKASLYIHRTKDQGDLYLPCKLDYTTFNKHL